MVVHHNEQDIDDRVDNTHNPHADVGPDQTTVSSGLHQVRSVCDPHECERTEAGHLNGALKGGSGRLAVGEDQDPPYNADRGVCRENHVDVGHVVLCA